MICFIKEIQDEPSVITKFDPVIWNTMLEQAVVNKGSSITFKFKVYDILNAKEFLNFQ